MEKILIGKVVNASGLRGELKIYPYTQSPERFLGLTRVFLGEEAAQVQGARLQGGLAVLKLRDIDDRNAAELRKGRDVYMEAADLEPVPAGTYYVRDLLGLPVEDKRLGRVGILADLLDNGPQQLFVVRREDGREFLIPAVEAFFTGLDPERRVLLVELIEGMYED